MLSFFKVILFSFMIMGSFECTQWKRSELVTILDIFFMHEDQLSQGVCFSCSLSNGEIYIAGKRGHCSFVPCNKARRFIIKDGYLQEPLSFVDYDMTRLTEKISEKKDRVRYKLVKK